MEPLSIENIGNDLEVRELSPLSKEAAFREGILLEDLAYQPKSTFEKPTILPEISRMRFDFFEKRR